MPKLKNHRGYKKRLSKTSTGKLKRKHAGQSHFLEKRTSKRKRKLQVADSVHDADKKRIKRMVPYL
ncbi:50S ribosomal protein L35 [Patescibacteria group bacterium]|nr:50S ribosomal protein L35 [Patescibacteria group bacterium]